MTRVIQRALPLFVLVIVGLFLHRGYLSSGVLVDGDMLWLSPQTLDMYFRWPTTWNFSEGLVLDGFGLANYNLNVEPLNIVFGLLHQLGLPFGIIQRIVIFIPAAILPGVAMYVFMGRYTPGAGPRVAAALVYLANTYVLTIGTQHLYLVIVYGLAPILWLTALSALDRAERRESKTRLVVSAVVFALFFAIGMAIDARMALLALGPIIVLSLRALVRHRSASLLVLFGGFIVATLLLQAYWLVPSLFGGGGSAYSEVLPSNPFVSFADFTHAITLHHPFYNGQEPVWFVTEAPSMFALVLPLLVLLGIWLGSKPKQAELATFGIFMLVGIFLVKGSNPPLPQAYEWLFENLPGMRLFRDSSKFTMWTAAGYSLFVGLLVEHSIVAVRTRFGKGAPTASESSPTRVVGAVLVLACLTASLAYGARAPIAGSMGWTYDSVEVPLGEAQFAEDLSAETQFGRVVWLPAISRFSDVSDEHPRMIMSNLFNVTEAWSGEPRDSFQLAQANTKTLDRKSLELAGVSRIAVLTDLTSDYWTDLLPTANQRRDLLDSYTDYLEGQDWLQVRKYSDSLTVYEVEGTREVFVQASNPEIDSVLEGSQLRSTRTGQLEFEVSNVDGDSVLRLGQKFDEGWVAKAGSDEELEHIRLADDTNAWVVPPGQPADIQVRYAPQKVANVAAVVSFVALLSAVGILIRARRSSRVSMAN